MQKNGPGHLKLGYGPMGSISGPQTVLNSFFITTFYRKIAPLCQDEVSVLPPHNSDKPIAKLSPPLVKATRETSTADNIRILLSEHIQQSQKQEKGSMNQWFSKLEPGTPGGL